MQITKQQIKQLQTIMSSRFSDREERLEFISSHFARPIKSTKELTIEEANNLIRFFNTGVRATSNWGSFDKTNAQHKKLMSLLHTAQWTVENSKWGAVPDLNRLDTFLRSDKSPVKKPLKAMKPFEVSKVITAFEGIVKSTFK